MKKERRLNLQTLPSIILLSVTIGVCCPWYMYMTNCSELWFSLVDIIIPCMLCGLALFALFAGICILLPSRGRMLYTCILFGLSLCLYIQGYIINTDYGVLDGRTIEWARYTGVMIWDTLLWMFVLIIPLIILKIKKGFAQKVINYGSFILLGIQALSIVILFFTNIDGSAMTGESEILTTEGMNMVSGDKNVVIFVLDTFDENYFDEIYHSNEDYISPLDGFTYFRNATCMYPTTAGSLPYMLTGQINRNEMPIKEYVKEAYKATDYYDILSENGYTIGLYVQDPRFVATDNDRLLFCNYHKSKPTISSYIGLSKTLYKFMAFRFFPDILKKYVWLYSDEFNEWKKNESFEGREIYKDDNVWYYNWLISNPLTFQDKGNNYKVIHVNGPHPPYTLNENLVTVTDGSANCITESKASLRIVFEYISQLKKLGAYDNTLIIVTADHGQTERPFSNPLLLIKPMKSNGGLKVSDSPVCHGDLQATVLQGIGLEKKNHFGESVFDIPESSKRQRQYFYYSWGGGLSAYLPALAEYSIDPKGNSESCFHLVNTEFHYYSLGERISFQTENTARQYWSVGLGQNEGVGTWMTGKEAVGGFWFGTEIKRDLEAHLECKMIFNHSQTVRVFANSKKVMDTVIHDSNEISFTIPKEIIKNDKLEIRIEFPDAISPSELGIGADNRLLSFFMTQMYIWETDSE